MILNKKVINKIVRKVLIEQKIIASEGGIAINQEFDVHLYDKFSINRLALY
ncbi:MAG: hypothetical protein V2I33_10350 [Kangiellaceae bacterium]|nr:hypothetical protein [Kangiellaceae bacterium]